MEDLIKEFEEIQAKIEENDISNPIFTRIEKWKRKIHEGYLFPTLYFLAVLLFITHGIIANELASRAILPYVLFYGYLGLILFTVTYPLFILVFETSFPRIIALLSKIPNNEFKDLNRKRDKMWQRLENALWKISYQLIGELEAYQKNLKETNGVSSYTKAQALNLRMKVAFVEEKSRKFDLESAVKLNSIQYRYLEKSFLGEFPHLDSNPSVASQPTKRLGTKTYLNRIKKILPKSIRRNVNKRTDSKPAILNVTESAPDDRKKRTRRKRYSNIEKQRKSSKIKLKIDFLELNIKKHEIGRLGELFALEYEKKYIKSQNLDPRFIKHVSMISDSYGYDIQSMFECGRTKFIEVKTTTRNFDSPFYMSSSEYKAMDELDNYFIYRFFNLDTTAGTAEIRIIDCKKNFRHKFKTEPSLYSVSPR